MAQFIIPCFKVKLDPRNTSLYATSELWKLNGTHRGLSSSCGCRRAKRPSSFMRCDWVRMKCLAAAISSTVTTQGWASNLLVTRTFFTLPAKVFLTQGTSASTSLRFRLSTPMAQSKQMELKSHHLYGAFTVTCTDTTTVRYGFLMGVTVNIMVPSSIVTCMQHFAHNIGTSLSIFYESHSKSQQC